MSALFFEKPEPGTPPPTRQEFINRGLIAWREGDERPRPPRWAAFHSRMHQTIDGQGRAFPLRLDEKAQVSAARDVLDFVENGAWADREERNVSI